MAEYSPLAPATDTPDTWRQLRETCPAHRFEAEGEPFFTLSRHTDVWRMFGDARAWSASLGQGPARTLEPGIRTDAPEHTLHRRPLNRVLAREAVAEREGEVRAIVEQAVEDLPAGGGDLLDDLTGLVPLRVFAPVLGLAPAEIFELWRHTHAVLTARRASPIGQVAPWDAAMASPAWQAARRMVTPRIEARRVLAGRVDLLLALAEATDGEGRVLPEEALVQVVMLVLFGAVHTAATMLTNAALRLLERGELWDALCADPGLAAAAIEESIRFDTPVAGIFRTAAGPQSLHGIEIPDGAKVRGLFAAANRDPEAFDHPDTFRLDRPSSEAARHLGFGLGVHICAGAPLARLQGRVLLETLARELPGLRAVGTPPWWDGRNAVTLLARHELAPVAW